MFGLWVFVTALVAGGVAAVSGFGIGSLLTPLLAVRYGTKLAVAIVSIPHLVGTTARFVGLRRQLDRRVLPLVHYWLTSRRSSLLQTNVHFSMNL